MRFYCTFRVAFSTPEVYIILYNLYLSVKKSEVEGLLRWEYVVPSSSLGLGSGSCIHRAVWPVLWGWAEPSVAVSLWPAGLLPLHPGAVFQLWLLWVQIWSPKYSGCFLFSNWNDVCSMFCSTLWRDVQVRSQNRVQLHSGKPVLCPPIGTSLGLMHFLKILWLCVDFWLQITTKNK